MTGMPGTRKEWSTVSSPTAPATLAEDGLLVFIVPRPRLAVSARYLATHYGTLRCWAFPRPEREAYQPGGAHGVPEG